MTGTEMPSQEKSINPGGTLPQRVARGTAWVLALRMTDNLLGLIRLIILARILAPQDFGLMGMAMLALAVLESFSQLGFQAALVQKKEKAETYLHTAWTIVVIRGTVLFLLLFLLAPPAAVFFKSPAIKTIIQAVALSYLFQAFTNIGVTFLQKELEFNKQFLYQISGTIAGFVVGVLAAVLLRSVWALVVGYLAGNLTRCLVSYAVHPFRPRLHLDRGQARELFGFGRWVLGSTFLMFLITQGDDLFVGKFLGAAMLAFYQMAYRLSNLPATEITRVISEVTFPAYSKLQEDSRQLQKAYLKVLQVTAFFSVPLAGIVVLQASELTRLFLGTKWLPQVPAMQLLAVWGLIRSIGGTTGPLFYGLGKPQFLTRLQLLQLILLAALIYPLTTPLGILGTSLAVVVAALVPNAISGILAAKMVEARPRQFLRLLFFPLLAAAGAFFMTSGLRLLTMKSMLLPVRFALELGLYLAVYFGISYFADRLSSCKTLTLLKDSWHKYFWTSRENGPSRG